MSQRVRTSGHFLHEDLDEAILADRAQVLHDVPVFQPLVQSDLLMEGLRIPLQTDRPTGNVRIGKPCSGWRGDRQTDRHTCRQTAHISTLNVFKLQSKGQRRNYKHDVVSEEPWGSTAATFLPNPFPLRRARKITFS